MSTLSIITAVHRDDGQYLAETIESAARQTLPEPWTLEWLVQEDGDEPRLEDRFAGLPWVRYAANGRQLGPGPTRNHALARATGELVRNLDHDDVLLPDALAGQLRHFADPTVHWAAAQADDLLADGSRRPYESAMPFGRLAPGAVNDWAIAHGGVWPIHCAGLMMRTRQVRAVGGWAATGDEDILMFAALSEGGHGYNDPAVTWLYRHHPRQFSRVPQTRANSSLGRTIAIQRIHAIRGTEVPAALDSPAVLEDKLPSGWWNETEK